MSFARIQVQPPSLSAAEPHPRLRLAGGRELLLPAAWPPEQLARLVRALEAQPLAEALSSAEDAA